MIAGAEKMPRKRSGASMPENMAAVDSSVGNATREQKAHGEARPQRVRMGSIDFKLSVPAHLIQPGKSYHWFVDREGKLSQAKAAWWEHVSDPTTGENVVRNFYGDPHYLMCIDEKYTIEDENLRQKEYYATIGKSTTDEAKQSGVEVETVVDEKRLSKDPFG